MGTRAPYCCCALVTRDTGHAGVTSTRINQSYRAQHPSTEHSNHWHRVRVGGSGFGAQHKTSVMKIHYERVTTSRQAKWVSSRASTSFARFQLLSENSRTRKSEGWGGEVGLATRHARVAETKKTGGKTIRISIYFVLRTRYSSIRYRKYVRVLPLGCCRMTLYLLVLGQHDNMIRHSKVIHSGEKNTNDHNDRSSDARRESRAVSRAPRRAYRGSAR